MQCNYSQIISSICKNDTYYFFNKANVVGVGRGYKVKGGFRTNQESIIVFVYSKHSKHCLCQNDLIPPLYKGVPTDVIESGYFKFQGLTKKIRPAPGGYSIGPEIVKNKASIGCLVTDGRKEYILTCNHAIVNEILKKGTTIIQPSFEDGGRGPNDIIGELYKFIKLGKSTAVLKVKNYVDAALISISNMSYATPIIYYVGIPKGPGKAYLNENVQKVGRTTEQTLGEITALDASIKIHFNGKNYSFMEQIITSKMTEDGDSGAVLLNYNKEVLGLTVGGTDSVSVYSTIDNVLYLLNVHIVTK